MGGGLQEGPGVGRVSAANWVIFFFWGRNVHQAENTILQTFFDNFCQFGRCFRLMTLSNARPLQLSQEGMNGDTFSIKAPKECSKKFAAIFKGKFLTRGNLLRIFFLFLKEFGAPL